MLDVDKHLTFPFDNVLSQSNFGEKQKNTILLENLVFLQNDDIQAAKINCQFTFELINNRLKDDKDSIIIICSKDNGHILDHSLSKIFEYNINSEHDILLVDDRSKSDDILNLSNKYNLSYLRIENSHDLFNYSVLNNIAVCYAKYYNKKLLIFYNNDVWPSNEYSFSNILNKHKKSQCDLSGCKLVYPLQKDYELLGKPQHILDTNINKVYNTIQHGGIFFSPRRSNFLDNEKYQIIYYPNHLWRFANNDHKIASSDTICYAVTGALHIVDTDKFIRVNGFNISMSTAFQDIDLCIKLLENNLCINYIGSEYMYHAESLTILQNNCHRSKQMISDNLLWDYLWKSKLLKILGYENLL